MHARTPFLLVLLSWISLVSSLGCASSSAARADRVIRTKCYGEVSAPAGACQKPVCPVARVEAFSLDAGGRLRRIGVTDTKGELTIGSCHDLVARSRLLLFCRDGFSCGVIDLCKGGERWCDYVEPDEVAMAPSSPMPSRLLSTAPRDKKGVRIVVASDPGPEPLPDSTVYVVPRAGGLDVMGRTDREGAVEIDEFEWSDESPVVVVARGPEGFWSSAIVLDDYRTAVGQTLVVVVSSFHSAF
jgi:hypothetical protein